MGFALRRVWAGALALSLLLVGRHAGAQDEPQPQLPPAIQEVGTELSPTEQSGFNALKGSMDAATSAALFDLLDHMDLGARGAFVSTLLDKKPEQRSNILAFLAKLSAKQRAGIADMITQVNYMQRQWTNFFDYVGSASPDESVSKIFVSSTQHGLKVTAQDPLMIWRDLEINCTPGYNPSCGWSFSMPPPLVVGGDFAPPTPWQAELYMSDKAGLPYTPQEIKDEFKMFGLHLSTFQRAHSCGGILLPGNWVLTAAHCIWDDPRFGRFIDERRVRTGTADLSTFGGTTWRIVSVVRHAGYNGPKKNDIALLKIEADAQTKLKDNHLAHPIALPAGSASAAPNGATLTVTGWGATGHSAIGNTMRALNGEPQVPVGALMEAKLRKVPISTCNNNPNYKAAGYSVEEGQVCALGINNNSDTCQGDSGGPLVYLTRKGPRLVGVISFGPGCGLPNTPGVYTDVAYYRSWILGAMKEAKPGEELAWQEGAPATPLH